MNTRRHLPNEVKKLQQTELILCLPLRKDFARRPAYWIEIYAQRSGRGRYFVTRQWSFMRSGEFIQGENVGHSTFDLDKAIKIVENSLEQKISGGWLTCTIAYDPNPPMVHPTNKELPIISNFLHNMGNIGSQPKVTVTQKPKKILSRSEKFALAQKKRKGKAEW